MGTQRLTRVNELLRREIADGLFRVMNEQAFDLAAVTVTRVETSSNLRQARVFVSIRGEEADQRRMFGLLRKHRPQLQRLLSKHVILKYTPHLHFDLDASVSQGDHILALLHELEPEPDEDGGPGPGDEEGAGRDPGEAPDA